MSYLKRETSAALKGVALLFMVVHHFFTYPEWYVEGISYPFLEAVSQYLVAPLKLCIAVFAFLTGYFYFYSSRKTLGYSLRKILDLLIPHSVVCIFMTALACMLGCFSLTVPGIVLELAGLGETVMKFSWYVPFYCIAMLLLPLVDRLSTGKPAGDMAVMLVLPVAAVQCLLVTMYEQFHLDIPLMTAVLESFREWFPVVVCGWLFAKYTLFENWLDGVTGRFSGKTGKVLLWICLCGIAFAGRLALPRFRLGAIQSAGVWSELVFTMDILYAPLFVYGGAKLLEAIKWSPVQNMLGALGRRSMYIWFLHAMFFNCCAPALQPLVYWPHNPVLVLLLALAVCYALAAAMDFVVRPVLKWKNKVL